MLRDKTTGLDMKIEKQGVIGRDFYISHFHVQMDEVLLDEIRSTRREVVLKHEIMSL